MIKDTALWEAWERETVLRQPADFRRNLRLLEAMYEEARALGVMSVPQALEGLESRLRLARVLNHRWMREFDRGLGERSLERFEEARQALPTPSDGPSSS
ncbi:MAG: hypothetical protein ABSE93_06420 [Terriglobia bacterium]